MYNKDKLDIVEERRLIYKSANIMRKGIATTILIATLMLTVGGLTSSALANDVPGHPEPAPENIPVGPQTGGELKTIFESIIDWIFVFFLILATIFIILAGFQFLTGGGDPNKVAEARQKLLYAIIAVIVASFAKGIPIVVKSIVGG